MAGMPTATRSESFEEKLRNGQVAETQIAKWLMKKGYCVMPVYEKVIDEGKGPQIFSSDGELVAPDMQVFNAERTLWVEAKQKRVFTWHRITERWTTGIDLRHYNDYQQVAELSPWPVWLFFLHTQKHTTEKPYNCPSGLYGRSLAYLNEHENHQSENWGPTGMVYWAVDTLMRYTDVDAQGRIV